MFNVGCANLNKKYWKIRSREIWFQGIQSGLLAVVHSNYKDSIFNRRHNYCEHNSWKLTIRLLSNLVNVKICQRIMLLH